MMSELGMSSVRKSRSKKPQKKIFSAGPFFVMFDYAQFGALFDYEGGRSLTYIWFLPPCPREPRAAEGQDQQPY